MFGVSLNFDPTHLASLVKDWVKDVKTESRLRQLLKEMLLVELQWNKAVLDEYIKTKKNLNGTELADKIAEQLSFRNMEKILEVGFPLSVLFEGDYKPKPYKKRTYSNYTKDIKTDVELINRTYHRLRFFQLRSQLQINTKQNSSNYLEFLCYQAILALKK